MLIADSGVIRPSFRGIGGRYYAAGRHVFKPSAIAPSPTGSTKCALHHASARATRPFRAEYVFLEFIDANYQTPSSRGGMPGGRTSPAHCVEVSGPMYVELISRFRFKLASVQFHALPLPQSPTLLAHPHCDLESVIAEGLLRNSQRLKSDNRYGLAFKVCVL